MDEARMKWFFRYNVGYRVLALMLAVLLWFYVAGQRNPLVERSFNVPVEASYLSSRMVTVSSLPEVRVTVRGFRSLVQSMSVTDVKAYVDLRDRGEGVSFIPVKVRVPSGIEVVRTEPELVRVSLDYLEEKRVPVRVVVTGEPAPGFTTLTPVVSPAQVVVRGPRHLLGGIHEVRATLRVNGARGNISQRVGIQVAGAGVELHPGNVSVTVPVVSRWPVKTVAVVAGIVGQPKPGFEVGNITVEPATVEITGPPQVLAGISQVNTQPVDITGADSQVIRTTRAVLPKDVYPVRDGTLQVTVAINAVETNQLPKE